MCGNVRRNMEIPKKYSGNMYSKNKTSIQNKTKHNCVKISHFVEVTLHKETNIIVFKKGTMTLSIQTCPGTFNFNRSEHLPGERL